MQYTNNPTRVSNPNQNNTKCLAQTKSAWLYLKKEYVVATFISMFVDVLHLNLFAPANIIPDFKIKLPTKRWKHMYTYNYL